MAVKGFSVIPLLISLKNVILYLWLENEMEKIRRNLSRGRNTGRFDLLIRSVYFQMQGSSRWDTFPKLEGKMVQGILPGSCCSGWA